MPTFGKRLKAAMTASGFSSPKELAGKIKVSEQMIGRWLKSDTINCSGKHLLKLCLVLHVRAEWLGNGRGIPQRYDSREYSLEEAIRVFQSLGQRERVLYRDILGAILRYQED